MKQLQEVESGPNPPPPGTVDATQAGVNEASSAVVPYTDTSLMTRGPAGGGTGTAGSTQVATLAKRASIMPKPKWHPPWKLYRVIAGHLGWVRCVAVEPGNEVSMEVN